MRTYSIVGMNYIKTEDVVAALAVGTAVTLVREPQNEHDKNAVAVWVNRQKIGFIPKKHNMVLAQFIDQKGEFLPDAEPSIAAVMAMDSIPVGVRSIPARFVRSPNSGYPMVEV